MKCYLHRSSHIVSLEKIKEVFINLNDDVRIIYENDCEGLTLHCVNEEEAHRTLLVIHKLLKN